MKKITKYIIIFIIALSYLIIGNKFKIYIPCLFHEVTHLYCPGCGITRMLFSIIKLDFYQAFRYNMLLFILFPFGSFLIIENYYSLAINKTPLYKKINSKVWIILIIILLIYGLLRNIYPPLAPLKIR